MNQQILYNVDIFFVVSFLISGLQRWLIDLGSLNEMLDVLSTSLDNVEILDEIRAEVGDDVQDWMPILLNRLAQRKAMTKANKGEYPNKFLIS